MITIQHLVTNLLSQRWADLLEQKSQRFSALGNAKYPGVYLLAYTNRGLQNQPIDINDVFYVGMSNSDGGVKQRLINFMNGIESGKMHSGGERFFHNYAHGIPFSDFSSINDGKRFYIATLSIPCETRKGRRTAEDLEKMGEVARLEYYVMAHLKRNLGREPELNES